MGEAVPEKHCETCICGRRAPMQSSDARYIADGYARVTKPAGSVAWHEHLLAWAEYARRYGQQQTAERMAARGGFSYGEFIDLVGREPVTWAPRG